MWRFAAAQDVTRERLYEEVFFNCDNDQPRALLANRRGGGLKVYRARTKTRTTAFPGRYTRPSKGTCHKGIFEASLRGARARFLRGIPPCPPPSPAIRATTRGAGTLAAAR